jgi:hypothetical protein
VASLEILYFRVFLPEILLSNVDNGLLIRFCDCVSFRNDCRRCSFCDCVSFCNGYRAFVTGRVFVTALQAFSFVTAS